MVKSDHGAPLMKFKSLLQSQMSASSLAIEASAGTVKISCTHDSSHDVDMACVLIDVDGTVKSNDDVIFYGNTGDKLRGVSLLGDTLEADGWDADAEFEISVSNIDRRISKILFAISPYSSGIYLSDLRSASFFIRKDDQVIYEVKFDLTMVVEGDFILAGVYDLEEMSFNTPGVVLNGDFQSLLDSLSVKNNFSSSLPSSLFPNLLIPVSEHHHLSPYERMLHCVWGVENTMERHLDSLPDIYHSELMASLCQVWRNFPFTQVREQIVGTLIKSGVDWHASLDGQLERQDATLNEKIDDLIEHISKNESGGRGWGKSVVLALGEKTIEGYVKQAKPEHNDVLFNLLKQRWMLDYTTEAKAEDVLVQDLGL